MIKNNPVNSPQFYADLKGLQEMKASAKNDSPEALRQVAQQFEQMFLDMLMKSMRQANESFGEDSVFNSSEVRFYQGMLDSQMTMEMANKQSVGLADVLVKQLSRQLDVRMDQPADDDDKKAQKPLSESERLLNRAFDQAATAAVSTVMRQIQMQTERPPSATPVEDAVAELAEQLPEVTKPARDLPKRFDSPEAFVEGLLPLAEEVASELGVDPKVLLAQAALETGWGKHIIQQADGNSSFNLFNIKAGKRWEGDRAQVSTLEYRDGVAAKENAFFRSYDSYEQSFRDYVDFLKNSSRYQPALEVAADPQQYLQALQDAGYATDPAYADKITQIFEQRILAMGLGSAKEG